MQKQPNRFLAPILIAGITVGFLASAYKFIFSKSSASKQPRPNQSPNESIETKPSTTSSEDQTSTER